jgi:hypothetical protein
MEDLMQHKLMVLFTILVMLGLALDPVCVVRAQIQTPGNTSECPPYDSTLSKDLTFLHSLPPECVNVYKRLSRQSNITAGKQNTQPMTGAGSDSFGYTYDDSVSYSWIDASTNSGLIGDDEFTGPINIGFDFPFYGMPQSRLYFSTNGLITFGAGNWEGSGPGIPNDTNPNNFIASYWDDLRVGNPYNGGAIYYSQFGSAPDRYFVVEWRDVQNYGSATPFSFEAILHENGDIVLKYQSLPGSYWPTVGIEDSSGEDGLEYDYANLSALKAVRFQYPAPAAGVFISPASRTGGFAPISGATDFDITISNSGTLGADTYDLTMISNWPVTFYASDGVTPLRDSDADTVVDTGPILQGTSTSVIAKFSTPVGAHIGDDNMGIMNIISSFDLSKTKTIYLGMSVPAGFANVFQDNADGSMSFLTGDSNKTSWAKTTPDNYFGYNVAIAGLTNGNYIYAWSKYSSNAGNAWRDIEYVLLDRNGNIELPVTKLTNNSGTTMYTEDSAASVAIAPNGTIGIVWSRYIDNFSTDQFNSNIYFATLNASGNLLTGPTNITNNILWGAYSDLNVPRFYGPTIAASDDNRFILGWQEQQRGNLGGYINDVWYAVQSSGGTSLFPPTALTTSGMSWQPILNRLTDGKVIMTWGTDLDRLYYAVINSSGLISKSETSLGIYTNVNYSPDAIQLPNGKVALAWGAGTGVELAILDSSYDLVHGPTMAFNPASATSECLSVTTDASSRVIMTWAAPNSRLLYALGDSHGMFITDPMIYKMSGEHINIGCNGQGNAPYEIISAIRGNVGVAGVTISYVDGTPKTITADAKGNYVISVSVDWSGTVTPSKLGYTFTPPSRTHSNVQGDQTGQNYTAHYVAGADTAGVFRSSNGLLYLKNANTTGFADLGINYGVGGDYPIVGDWDGDGDATIGIYRNGAFYLRNENTIGFADWVFPFGMPGDQPIVGDWNGDGIDTIGVYRRGVFFLRDENSAGASCASFALGIAGDVGIAGDWDGDGVDTTGVFRPSNGALYLKNTNVTGFADIQINYGVPGDTPVTGDWDNDGVDTIGIYRNGMFMLRNSNTIGFADWVFALGVPGDMPIAGNWDGIP